MLRNDEQWLAVADGFHSAALGENGWHPALAAFAEATGSCAGELIGLGSQRSVPFNIVTGVAPEFPSDFAALGGGDPNINPRVRAGTGVPPLTVLAEHDYLTESEHRAHPFNREMEARWGVAYSCLTPLEIRDDLLIGLAVMRSTAEGHITHRQKEIFGSLASHARAAVRMQLALEGQGAALLSAAFESLSIAAFLCDGRGQVRALTAPAQALLGRSSSLQVTLNRLHTTDPAAARPLQDAIDAAACGLQRPGPPLQRTLVIRPAEPAGAPLVLTVASLPSTRHVFGFAPRVLVVVRGPQAQDGQRAAIVQAIYDLTPAETEVALMISRGESADAIAQRRQVSIGTVRVQIRAILGKVGVASQRELVARLSAL